MADRLSKTLSVTLLVLTLMSPAISAADPGWPREIQLSEGRIVVFQPQLEEFSGNHIVGRAAVSVTLADASAPVFGVVWIEARADVDRDDRLVTFYDITVPRVRFPEGEAANEEQLASLLEREIPTWELQISLDRILAQLSQVEGARATAEQLEMSPPTIVFRNTPTVLVMIDGEPIMESIEGTNLTRVINTPFLVVRDGDSRRYFIYAGTDAWYQAGDVKGPWTFTTRVPDSVAALAPDASDFELPEAGDSADPDVNPEIFVATEPTELIFSNGDPAYTPLADARLMYVSNTDGTIILELATQRHFIVLSGRWYVAGSLEGPWEFIESQDLPEAFRDIPEDSTIGDIRVHVAGTEEAQEAVVDAQIPQTATIERGRVDLEVAFDGAPQFEDIPGTNIQWSPNADKQVLAAEGRFWVVDEAVWYVSSSATGPWDVATERPAEVGSIPPDNPNYNVKYAYIYGSTPEVVYVGYTPGYTHTYVYKVTIVYGTGHWHHPWHHTHFWPRHSTWGFGPRWHPWTGWSFGVVFSNGRFTFGIGFGSWHPWHRGWWGPSPFHAHWRGFHRGFYTGWSRGFHAGARAGYRAGFRAGVRAGYRQSNLFRQPDRTGARVRDAAPRQGSINRPAVENLNRPGAVSRNQANNVFADRSGNVMQRDNAGNWQQRQGGNWSPASRNTTQQRSNLQSLNRTSNARARGTQRTNNFSGARAGGRRR